MEDKVGPGPFAAKSIGENSIVPTAPAIANAVEDAVGVRILDLPLTAEKVHSALRKEPDGQSRAGATQHECACGPFSR